MRLPRPSSMYIGRSQVGSNIEGRRTKNGGNTMKPGALTKYAKIFGVHRSQIQQDWSIFPLTVINYMTEIRSFLPHSLFMQGDELSVKRLETLSFWELSYQEIIRHLGLAQKLVRHDIYPEIMDIVNAYKEQIIDAFKKYVQMIINEGDFSIEQFKYYVHEHRDSASPWTGEKWSDIENRANRLKQAYAECLKWVKDYYEDLDKIMQYSTPMIKADYVYPALRARPADYDIVAINNDKIIARCSKHRDRKAGGVLGLSQLEWPIYHKVILKRKIYDECFYNLVREIAGCELNPIIITGAKFYQNIIERQTYCYDLRNAEKLVGMLLPFLPIMVDLGESHYDSSLASELYSGVGPTRPGSEIVVAICIRFLKERGFQINRMDLGGDNFGLDTYINAVDEGFDILFTNEDTILGWMVEAQKFGPYSFITDNVKNRWNVPKQWSALTSVQNYQFELRPLQVIVNNDLMRNKSAVKLINWICTTKDFENIEIYSKREIFDKLIETPQLHDSFRDLFADELNFLKQYVPVHQNSNKTTDAHLIVYR